MTDKPRKPWLAGLLTIFTIGLGHLYAGNPNKGIALYLSQAVLGAATIALFVISSSLTTLIVAFSCGVAYFVYCIVDAIKDAKRGKASYQLRKYNRWYVYLACWAAASILIQPVVAFSIKSNFIQAYKIPAGSNEPTLLIGDHILVDRRPSARVPKLNNLIVFEFPEDPRRDFVKRIVAVGGDTVEVRDKVLYLNGIKASDPYGINVESFTMPANGKNPRDFYGPVIVPEGHVFVLGDNRDRSYDSRFWGFVEEEKIKGTVKSIYWSWDSIDEAVRWERIGENVL